MKIQGWPKHWYFIVLSIFAIVAFSTSFANKLVWDDYDNITNNAYIKDWNKIPRYFNENFIAGAGFVSNYYRPLMLFLYSVEWHLWGNYAPGYHLTNLLIHLTNSILLFNVIAYLSKDRRMAFIVSLIFLVHPVQVESVTYVAGRTDPLFAMLTLFCITQFLNRRRLLSLVFFIGALLTKETAVIIPFVLVSISLYSKTIHQKTLQLAIFFLIDLVYILMRSTLLNFQNTFNLYNESNPYTDSLYLRFLTFTKVLPEYISWIFYPHNLHMERVVNLPFSIFETQVLFGLVILIASLLAFVYFLKTKPLISLAIFGYYLFLLPVSGILVPISGLLYEHWLYLPIVGVIVIFYHLARFLLKKIRAEDMIDWLGFGVVIVLSLVTYRQNLIWRTPISLYEHIIQFNKQSHRVYNNLGMAYAEEQNYPKAIENYKRAIDLDLKRVSAPPRHNLGNLYTQLNDFDLAKQYYLQAIEIDSHFLFSYLTLSKLYYDHREYAQARQTIKQAQKFFPSNIALTNALNQIDKTNTPLK